jgi:hypothetical protein
VTSAIKLFRDGGSSSALAVPRRSDYPYDGPVVIPKEFRGLVHGHVASIFALGLVVLPLCPETKGQPLPA